MPSAVKKITESSPASSVVGDACVADAAPAPATTASTTTSDAATRARKLNISSSLSLLPQDEMDIPDPSGLAATPLWPSQRQLEALCNPSPQMDGAHHPSPRRRCQSASAWGSSGSEPSLRPRRGSPRSLREGRVSSSLADGVRPSLAPDGDAGGRVAARMWRMTRTATGSAATERYTKLTPASRALWERALGSLPGGNSRTTIYQDPYPIYATRGEGCRVTDVDGVERIDFINNYTSLVLGHCHPRVVEAVQTTGRPAHERRRAERARGRDGRAHSRAAAERRAPALHELRHRGDHAGDPRGAGLHGPDHDRDVRRRVPRHARLRREHPGIRRRRTGRHGHPRGGRRFHRRGALQRRRGNASAARAAPGRPRRGHRRAGHGCGRRDPRGRAASSRSCASSRTRRARSSSSTRSSPSGSATTAPRAATASPRI